jgi:uncharacterized protein YsxB (DUF464 family)
MTEVCIFLKSGNIVGFQAKGHTGYAEEGNDIVCSAVSALTQSAVQGITELLKMNAAVSVSKGDLYCMLEKDAGPAELERAQIILGTMRLGLKTISDDYNRNLKIVEKEV